MRARMTAVTTMMALLAAGPATAAVYTAGAAGSYATVQAALDAAVLAGGDNEVRVQAGTYSENLYVGSNLASGSLLLTGGWDSGFSARDPDPASTIVDAGGSASALQIAADGGHLTVAGLTLTNGATAGSGGAGIYLRTTSDSVVVLEHLRVVGNMDSSSVFAGSAGIAALPLDTSRLELRDTEVSGNLATSSGSDAIGGGASLTAYGSSSILADRCRFEGNEVHSDSAVSTGAAGLWVNVYSAGSVVVSDCRITGNHVTGSGTTVGSGARMTVGQTTGATAPSLTVRRTVVTDNTSTMVTKGRQLYVRLYNDGEADLTDSVIASGDGGGLYTTGDGTSAVHATNLTVTGNAETGVTMELYSSAGASLANSIVYGNGTEISLNGSVVTSANLVGSDPHFKDPANGDFGVLADSPVIDEGDGAPPGGLGPLDVVRCPRVGGGGVDVGANEQASVSCGGFEAAGLSRWLVVP